MLAFQSVPMWRLTELIVRPRVDRSLPPCGFPYQALVVFGKGHYAWRCALSLCGRNYDNTAALYNSDTAVRRSQIDANGFTHITQLLSASECVHPAHIIDAAQAQAHPAHSVQIHVELLRVLLITLGSILILLKYLAVLHAVGVKLNGAADVIYRVDGIPKAVVGKRTEIIPSGVSVCADNLAEDQNGLLILLVLDRGNSLPDLRRVSGLNLWNENPVRLRIVIFKIKSETKEVVKAA